MVHTTTQITHALNFVYGGLKELDSLQRMTIPNAQKIFSGYKRGELRTLSSEEQHKLPTFIKTINNQFDLIKQPGFFRNLRQELKSLYQQWKSIRPKLLGEVSNLEQGSAKAVDRAESRPVINSNAPERKFLDGELDVKTHLNLALANQRIPMLTRFFGSLHSPNKVTIDLRERILFSALQNLLKEKSDKAAKELKNIVQSNKSKLLRENENDLGSLINKRLGQLAYLIDYQLGSCYEERSKINYEVPNEKQQHDLEVEIYKLENLLRQFRFFKSITENSKTSGIKAAIQEAFTVEKFSKSANVCELPTKEAAENYEQSRKFIDFTKIQKDYNLAEYYSFA